MQMFDRLQKPFLTVRTGEAYQPIRLTFHLHKPDQLESALSQLRCIEKNTTLNSWSWYWRDECEDLHFESIDSFRKNPENPERLATITLREGKFYLNLPSFKRACLAVPFFHKKISKDILTIHVADFINKVFALDERLPHGFVELFKEEELDRILHQRVEDYHQVKERCEDAETAEAAFKILHDYTKAEAQKRLPYAERYIFDLAQQDDPDIVFLAFYIFLRGRELVAIKRWFGQTGYTLADAADETIEQVFGGLGVDIIE
jgi:hypothetical protein